MTANSNLLKAILSMDSYNRGYNAGLIFGSDSNSSEAIDGVTKIGNYTIYRSSNTQAAADIGFYGIAYQVGNEVVIAYRGTDDGLLSKDLSYGFGVGAGYATSGSIPGSIQNPAPQRATPNQGDMAFEFYRAVAEQMQGGGAGINPYSPDTQITLTGHSLGGGLAGLVASTYNQDATLFDSMAFKSASENLAWAVNYYTNYGEQAYKNFLIDKASEGSVRGYPSVQALKEIFGISGSLDIPTLESGEDYGVYYSKVSALAIAGAISTHSYVPYEDPEIVVPTGMGSGQGAIDRHSIASHVIALYGQEAGKSLTSTMWDVLYNNDFARNVGAMREGSLASAANVYEHKNADILRTMIAYSALTLDATGLSVAQQKERLPFGDTAIRALFDDTQDLFSMSPSIFSDSYKAASRLIAEYAANLADAQVLQSQNAAAVNGIVSVSNNITHIDLSDAMWTFDENIGPVTIVYKTELLKSFTAQSSLSFGVSDLDGVLNTVEHVYFLPSVITYDFSSLALTDEGKRILIYTSVYQGHGDEITGSTNDDIIITGAGNDTIIGGQGNDIIDAGNGDDTVTGGAGNDIVDLGSGNNTYIDSAGHDTVRNYSPNGVADYSGAVGPIFVDGGSQLLVMSADGYMDRLDGFSVFKGSMTARNYFEYLDEAQVHGGQASDIFWVSGASNTLYGGGGNDRFSYIGTNNTTIYGGEGDDAFSLTGWSAAGTAVGSMLGSKIYDEGSSTGDMLVLPSLPTSYLSLPVSSHENIHTSHYFYGLELQSIEGATIVKQVRYIGDYNYYYSSGNYTLTYSYDTEVGRLQVNDGIEYLATNGGIYLISDLLGGSLAPSNSSGTASGERFPTFTDVLQQNFSSVVLPGDGVGPFITGYAATNINYNSQYSQTNSVFSIAGVAAGTYQTAQGGSISIQSNGNYTYSPQSGFIGEDSYTYTYNGQSITHRFIVRSSENSIQAIDDVFTNDVLANTTVSGNVISNDEGSNITVRSGLIQTQNGGTVIMNKDGTYTYTPKENFSGTDSFTYHLEGQLGADQFNYYLGQYGLTDTAQVTFNVRPSNSRPVAVNDSFSGLTEDAWFIGNVLSNDSDPDGDAFTVVHHSQGTKGLVEIAPDGTFTYKPYENVFGLDSFNYTIRDAYGAMHTSTVQLNITVTNNDLPIVQNVSFSVNASVYNNYNNGVIFPFGARDVDGEYLSLIEQTITTADGNTIVLSDFGGYSFYANAGYVGEDSFTFVVSDQTGNSVTGSASVNILAPEWAYTGTVGRDVLNVSGANGTLYGLAGNDLLIGAEGDDLLSGGKGNDTLYGSGGTDTLYGNSGEDVYVFDMTLAYGASWQPTTIIDSEGVDIVVFKGIDFSDLMFSQNGDALSISFADLPNVWVHSQLPMVEYILLDGNYIVDLSTMTQIAAFHMPLAANDAFTMKGISSLSGNVLLDNGSGADTASANAEISVRAGTYSTEAGGTVVLQEDGSFIYTHLEGFYGIDRFDYSVFNSEYDGTTATVSITVKPENEAPVAIERAFDAELNSALVGNLIAPIVGDPVVDPEGASVIAVAGTFMTSSGNNVIIFADGNFVYAAQDSYLGEDTFTYTVEDPTGLSSTSMVTITVTPPVGAIVGTEFQDNIFGTSNGEIIYALSGNDEIYTMGGEDTIYGGSGVDRVFYTDISQPSDLVIYRTAEETYHVYNLNTESTNTFHSIEAIDIWGSIVDLASLNLDIDGSGWGNNTLYGSSGNDTITGTRATILSMPVKV